MGSCFHHEDLKKSYHKKSINSISDPSTQDSPFFLEIIPPSEKDLNESNA